MQEDKDKKLEGIIDDLLTNLKHNFKEIISLRFGLGIDKPQTLAAIGRKKNITRERVRQIIVESFKISQRKEQTKRVKSAVSVLENIIEDEGGISGMSEIMRKFFSLKGETSLEDINRIKILLNVSKKIKYRRSNLQMKELWYLKEKGDKIKDVLELNKEVVKYFKEEKKALTFDELLKNRNFNNYFKEDFLNGKLNPKILRLILEESNLLQKNILGQWGLAKWKIISPVGSREKTYLIYKKYKKPLHFRELTAYINEHWKDRRKALPQTVHNTIIKYPEFVVIDSGVYALKEWIHLDKNLLDKIINFFENRRKKATIDEIITSLGNFESDYESIKITIMSILYQEKMFIRRNGKYMLK